MPSTRAIAKVILTAVAIAALLYFLYLIRKVIGALVIAIFIAIALAPAVRFFEERLRLPRVAAILLTYVAILLGLFGIGLVLVPPIVDEVENFVENVPGYVEELRENKTIREYDEKYKITDKLQDQAEQLPGRLSDAAGALQSVTVGIFSAVFQLVIVLVMSVFFLIDGSRMIGFFYRQLGGDREERARIIARDISRAVGGYVAGAFSISLIAGVATFIVLKLLGIPFSVPLSVLMGFCVLIPLVGSAIAGAIIGVVAAFEDFPTTLILWVVFVVVYQQVENHVLQPQVYKRTVDLHPLLVIVAVLTGASLLGILGALLAIPAAATIQILVKEYWRYRHGTLFPEATEGDDEPPSTRGPPAGDARAAAEPAGEPRPVAAPPAREPRPEKKQRARQARRKAGARAGDGAQGKQPQPPARGKRPNATPRADDERPRATPPAGEKRPKAPPPTRDEHPGAAPPARDEPPARRTPADAKRPPDEHPPEGRDLKRG